MDKPRHWFKSIHEAREDLDLKVGYLEEPIEYLKISTGETFIHTGGTAYWNHDEWEGLNIHALVLAGITHYRLVNL